MALPHSIGGFLRGRIFQLLAAVLFTALMGVLITRNVSWSLVSDIFGYLDFFSALMGLLAYAGVTAIRAKRFLLAGARVPFETAFQIAAVHAALMRVTPLRSGELAYAVLMKKKGGGSFTQGMAELVVLRVLDIAALGPLGALAAGILVTGSGMAAAAFALMGVLLFAFYFFARPVFSKLEARITAGGEGGLRGKIAGLLRQLVAMYDLPLRQRISLVVWTGFMWAMVVVWFCFVLLSIGAVPGAVQGIGAGILGIMGSVLPLSLFGSFGPLEGALAVGLGAMGQSPELALSGALVTSVLMFLDNWLVAIPAWVAFLLTDSPAAPGGAARGAGIKERALQVLGHLLFAAAGGLLLLYRLPYGFETNDQYQYLLLPYRSIYDGFLTGDWFTWETTHYHVAFSWFIRFLHGVAGEARFPYAVFATHALVLCAVAFSLLRTAKAAGFGWIAAAAALMTVGFVSHFGIAGALVNHGVLLPADMALAPFLLGVAFLVQDRRLISGLFLGLAGLLHANFAILAPMAVAGPEAIHMARTRRIRPTLLLAGGFLLMAWPTLIASVVAVVTADPAPGALAVLFEVRSPHHYMPSFREATPIAWLLVLTAAGLPVWLTGGSAALGRLRGIALSLAALQVLAYLGTAMEIGFLIRLFFWRFSVPLALILAVAAGQTLVRAVTEGRLSWLLYGAAAVPLVASFAAKGEVITAPSLFLGGYGLLVPLVIPLTAAAILMRLGTGRLVHMIAAVLAASALAWTLTVSLPGVAVAPRRMLRWQSAEAKWSELTHIDDDRITGRRQALSLYAWIRKHTPRDASFLIPPGQDSFRLMARRAVFVDWKCCPMKGSEVLEWQRRMLQVMGTNRFPAKGYALHRAADARYRRRPLKALADLARKEGITHIATPMNSPDVAAADAGLKRLVRKSGLTVYQVIDAPR